MDYNCFIDIKAITSSQGMNESLFSRRWQMDFNILSTKCQGEKKSIFNGVIFPVAADFRDNASQAFGWLRQPNSQLWFQVKQFLVLICSWSDCLAYELLPSDLVIKWPSYLLLLHIKLSICWKWDYLCCLAWKKCTRESKIWQRTILMMQKGPN